MTTICLHSKSSSHQHDAVQVFSDSPGEATSKSTRKRDQTISTAPISSPQTHGSLVFLTLVNKKSGVLPKKVHINSGSRTKVTIGRGDASDVVVRLKKNGNCFREKICVSREHCEIEKNPCGEWALFDKGSRNGCFVNGVKVDSTVLHDGDIIILGGGGIVENGARVPNVESMFEYKFTKVDPNSRTSKKVGAKRKLAMSLSSCSQNAKRPANDKENVCGHSASILQPTGQCSSRSSGCGASDEIKDELSCGICLEVQIHPRALACGHSFCARCISTALSYKNRCPTCKAVVTAEPQKIVSLENVINSLFHNVPEYKTRCQEYDKLVQHERITSEKLVNVISKARTSGKRFLVADKKWSRQEQDIFKTGVALYKGQARIEYCRTVGLTDDFVQSATSEQLIMVAFNVGINLSTECSLQDRLRLFIRFG